jgi:hypothetical protein
MRSWLMLMRRQGNHTWYYRRTVPRKLRPLMDGRKQIWKSLRTTGFNQAKHLSLQVGQEVERELPALTNHADELRRTVDLPAAPEAFARDLIGRSGTFRND